MNVNELITVVALADDLSVAKQTIFYHCNKLQIEAKKIDNVSYLTHAEAEAIKQRINKNNKQTNNKRDTEQSEATENNSNNTDLSELIELLTKQIDDLKQDKQNYERQLQVKDSQIKQLNDTLDEQQQLLHNQQSLQLQSNDKIKALEIELQEVKDDTSKAETSKTPVSDNKVDDFYKDLREDEKQNKNIRNEKKNGLLSRFFRG